MWAMTKSQFPVRRAVSWRHSNTPRYKKCTTFIATRSYCLGIGIYMFRFTSLFLCTTCIKRTRWESSWWKEDRKWLIRSITDFHYGNCLGGQIEYSLFRFVSKTQRLHSSTYRKLPAEKVYIVTVFSYILFSLSCK